MLYFLSVLILLFVIILAKTLIVKTGQLDFEPVEKIPLGCDILEHLSQAIQFPTISYHQFKLFDKEAFKKLHKYLENTFPLMHRELDKEVINELGLLYIWKGSNSLLKPILIMAHQDVVPIEKGTKGDWTVPPFSGTVKDGYIWGRGTLDIKSSLVGINEAVESLIRDGYCPERTIYIAYGFDEEIKGERGAMKIAEVLKERQVSFECVLDEGGKILTDMIPNISKNVAFIGIAEKGFVSLELVVNSPGGHSSMPPKKTAVGILANAIQRIEKHPFPAKLENISRKSFAAIVQEISFGGRILLANLWLFKYILIKYLTIFPYGNAFVRTTCVVTMLKGSPTDNVLPQKAKAVLNVRIFPRESIDSVKAYLKKIIRDPRVNIIHSNKWDFSNPSPISDTDTPSYKAIQQSIMEIFPNTVVVPFLTLGTTDSKHYSSLTKNVYRFVPLVMSKKDLKRVHSTDERINTDNYKDIIRFYMQFIKNIC